MLLSVFGAVFAVFESNYLQSRLAALPETPSGMAIGLGLVIVLISTILLLSWVLDLVWLNRAGWAEMPAVWRRGLQPRVLATSAVQWIRPSLVFFPRAAAVGSLVVVLRRIHAPVRTST